MAKYKQTEKEQGLFLTASLPDQLVDGTFEHTLDHLIDTMDLSVFGARYANGLTEYWPSIRPHCSKSYCTAIQSASSVPAK